MDQEKYHPSSEDVESAEQSMGAEQREQSVEREKAFATLKPPEFYPNGSALLHIDRRLVYTDNINDMAEAEEYVQKGEFHATIIGTRTSKKIMAELAKLPPLEKASKLGEIKRLIRKTEWTIASKPKLYRITKQYPPEKPGREQESRTSMIQPLELVDFEEFYIKLSGIVGIDLKPQFTHITLFTKGTNPKTSKVGIGLDSKEDFEALNPELLEQ